MIQKTPQGPVGRLKRTNDLQMQAVLEGVALPTMFTYVKHIIEGDLENDPTYVP